MAYSTKYEQVLTNCTVGGPVYVYVRDGKIVRIRPLFYGPDDSQSWAIEANGKIFSPPRKASIAPYIQAAKKWVYSKNRLLYPLKRVDFDPDGERHPEMRGKSEYERISWDQALTIISNEIKRLKSEYGSSAIMMTEGSHMNWGNINYRHSTFLRFQNLLGRTVIDHNPDSWEGWLWGAVHTFGFNWRRGCPEQYDLLEDTMKNSDLIVSWSNDPDSTRGIYGGQDSANWRLWLKQLGKKMIFVDPFCNYTAATLADRWIAPRAGTDTALAAAIAYVWIIEGTYDHDYITTRTFGFDAWRDYITGKEDGIAKTTEWAERLTLIPARVIRALAREWASGRTMLCCGSIGGWGGACRMAYAHEWARMMVLLQAMQGYGKPGVNIWSLATGAPQNTEFFFPGYAECGIAGDGGGLKYIVPRGMVKIPTSTPIGNQRVYRLYLPEIIQGLPCQWRGEGAAGKTTAQQFMLSEYPSKTGNSQVRMFHRMGCSSFGTMTETNRWVAAYQSHKLEFLSCQATHFDGEAKFCDIVLPACTNFERPDIGEWANCSGYIPHTTNACSHRVIVYMKKCIEPLGESKSDYEICTLLANSLGFKDIFTEGNTDEDWIKRMFDVSDLPKHISFEKFKEKGYFVVPFPENYKSTPALRWFYEGRNRDTADWGPLPADMPDWGNRTGLATPSGKIEFLAQSLEKFDAGDKERPPVPHYIPSWEGHETELAKKYPLALISPHPRFSFHTHYDVAHHPWLNEIPGHRIVKDGHAYWVIRIHPSDARKRNIKNHDIIRMYNDRGNVVGIAHITERASPGMVHSYGSSGQYDPLEPGKAGSTDRGGCVNLLTSSKMMSTNASGMAPNSCLVEIEKWEDQ